MKKIALIPLLLSILLFSCEPKKDTPQDKASLVEAKGDRYYGGVFRLNESEYIKTLFPHSIIDAYSYRVASQIYEGLFKFDQDSLTLIPSLVESYEVDEMNTVYTFKLKDNVFFHDDECFPGGKGRKMVAEDVKYCFTSLATQSLNNQSFNLLDGIVKGARSYYDATAGGQQPSFELEGIEVIDDVTIRFTLEKPNSMFLFNLARPGAFIFPKEAYDKYGVEMRIKTVGTGPFKLASVDEDISLILKKNEAYHGIDQFGNKLPFLDALHVKFLKDKKVELLEFKKGNLDMMYRLPTDYIIEILAETESDADRGYSQYELTRDPEMSTQLLLFNNQGEIFKDINVRKAFSFAIDREKILDFVLNGEGYMEGYYGVTPPSFKGYDITDINGYDFNLDSAKIYLAKAGYKDGDNFPPITLDLNSEGERYTNVAIEVQKQLKDHLNITIDLNFSPIAQITEKGTSGDFDMLRIAWVADYPSPENYLWAYYGKSVPESSADKSYPNMSRYKNSKFDQLYEMAIDAPNNSDALQYFMEAEKILMQDAPGLILWYDEGYRLMQSNIKNFPSNPMQYRDFSAVYMVPMESNASSNN